MSKYLGRSAARIARARARLGHRSKTEEDSQPDVEAPATSAAAESAPAAVADDAALATAASTPPATDSTEPQDSAADSHFKTRRLLIQGTLAAGAAGLAAVTAPALFHQPMQPPLPPKRPPQLFETPADYVASTEFPELPQSEEAEIVKGPLLSDRSLAIYNENTGELVRATYWSDGDYVLEELESIQRVLRDHHVNVMHAIDLRLLELMHIIKKRLDTNEPFHVLSAYRTRTTNTKLNEIYDGVALTSFHIMGKAIDLRVPGQDKKDLVRAALSLRAGGVGEYRRYIHLDTGPYRTWRRV